MQATTTFGCADFWYVNHAFAAQSVADAFGVERLAKDEKLAFGPLRRSIQLTINPLEDGTCLIVVAIADEGAFG